VSEEAQAGRMTLACEHVDVALSLQQTIRDRDRDRGPDVVIGDACGEPSVGSIDDVDGSRRHFCSRHRLQAPIVRD
jgi:hypothetical protein